MEYLALLSTSGLYTLLSMSTTEEELSPLSAAGETSSGVSGQPVVLRLQGDVPGMSPVPHYMTIFNKRQQLLHVGFFPYFGFSHELFANLYYFYTTLVEG